MVGDVVQGGNGDDLILGFDPRQRGSAPTNATDCPTRAAAGCRWLGGPDGRGHSRGDGRDVIVPHAFLALLGSDRGDVLTGSPYGDEILGRAGADLMDGGGGRDALVDGPVGAREGDDVLSAASAATSYVVRRSRPAGGRRRGRRLTLPTLRSASSRFRAARLRHPHGRRARRGACVNVVGGGGADELLPSVASEARTARVDVDLKRGEFGVRVRQAVLRLRRLGGGPDMVNQFTGADGPRWHVRGTGVDETVLLRKGASIWASMAGGDDRVSGNSGRRQPQGRPRRRPALWRRWPQHRQRRQRDRHLPQGGVQEGVRVAGG